ncbi:MAG: inositol monophosphatase, partial [Acidimicrobiia bacterium]|nr:inositol monophosphatase [Acidimicrobiia bacterium]
VDPVTATDLQSEQAILTVIHAHRPHDAILAEEGNRNKPGSGRRWIIDPLDGTVNFISGVPHFAVSIGLWDGDSPLVGVVVDVMRDDLFAASRGNGTTLNGKPITVSDGADLGSSLLVTGFPYDRQERADAYTAPVAEALRVARGVRRFGSAALDLAWVAAGRMDGYWEFGLKPWDVAAGILLVTEAGGRVTNESGGEAGLEDRFILATNGGIHRSLETLLQPAISDVLGR